MHETPGDWTDEQRALFSRMLRHMQAFPEMFTRPGAPQIGADNWETISWNAAWIAAMFSADCDPIVHCDEQLNELAAEIPSSRLC